MTKSSTTQSLRDLALDTINGIAAELRKADPSLSKAQAVARAAQTPAGRSAYSIYKLPGAQQPWLDAVKSLTKGTSGSGPRGGRIEDPKITGPKVPGDMLKPPAQTAGRKVRQAVQRLVACPTNAPQQQEPKQGVIEGPGIVTGDGNKHPTFAFGPSPHLRSH